MIARMRFAVIFAVVLGLSCGGGSLKRAGETCSASSECAAGLICDDGKTPHVCAGMGSLDAFVPEIDAPVTHTDAAPGTDGQQPTPDAHMTDAAVTPDAPSPDAAQPDAAVTPDAAVMADAPTD